MLSGPKSRLAERRKKVNGTAGLKMSTHIRTDSEHVSHPKGTTAVPGGPRRHSGLTPSVCQGEGEGEGPSLCTQALH